jgi:type IV pilus assembly protein PilX
MNHRHINSRFAQNGISLIIVLILVVVIGVTASSAMRSATSGQRVTNNVRMDNMAQQYAEAALRFCEAQMAIPSTNVAPLPVRDGRLMAPPVININAGVAPAWLNPVSWRGASTAPMTPPHAAATRIALTAGQVSSAASTYTPTRLPECIVETQSIGGLVAPFNVTVVTARGFSTDYREDAATGATTNGSVVWLQSILNL